MIVPAVVQIHARHAGCVATIATVAVLRKSFPDLVVVKHLL